MDVLIGVDIGQRVDPSAIAGVERQDRGGEDHYVARHLERLPLGTSSPTVAERVAAIVAAVQGRVERRRVVEPVYEDPYWQTPSRTVVREQVVRPHVTLYLDATGLGQPVVDLLKVAGVRPVGCYFTHGDRRAVEGSEIRIGKAWLVSRLQVLLQTGRLHLPHTAEAQVLAKELQDYEIRVDQDANDKYGAFKVGSHDDLVTALGLAVQPPRPRWGVI